MAVACDGTVDLAGIFSDRSVDKGNVVLFDGSSAELFRESFVYLFVFCDDDKTRGVFVEAVNDADSVRTACVSGRPVAEARALARA